MDMKMDISHLKHFKVLEKNPWGAYFFRLKKLWAHCRMAPSSFEVTGLWTLLRKTPLWVDTYAKLKFSPAKNQNFRRIISVKELKWLISLQKKVVEKTFQCRRDCDL